MPYLRPRISNANKRVTAIRLRISGATRTVSAVYVRQNGSSVQVFPAWTNVTDRATFSITENNSAARLYGSDYLYGSATLVNGQKYYVHARSNVPTGEGLQTYASFTASGFSPAVSFSGTASGSNAVAFDSSGIYTATASTSALTFGGSYANWYSIPYQWDVINVNYLVQMGFTDAQIKAYCDAQCKGKTGTYKLTMS